MDAILFLLEAWFIIVLIFIGIMGISRILDAYEDYGDND